MKFTTVSPQIKEAFQKKMEETLQICRSKSGQNIPTPPLYFSQMGERAGINHNEWTRTGFGKLGWTLKPNTSYIVINPDYLKKYWDDMLNDTCPHEVAHYVAVFLYGIQGNGHNHLWKRVMSWIGIHAADRCHQYDTEGVKLRNTHRDYKYICGCSNPVHWLTPKKHQTHQLSVSNGRKGLFCRRCHHFLIYEGFNHNGTFIPAVKKLEPNHIELQPTVFNIPPAAPTPAPVIEPATAPTQFKTVTKFINGMLVNVKVPVA